MKRVSVGCVWWAMWSDSLFPWVEGILSLYSLGVFWCFRFSPHQYFPSSHSSHPLLQCLLLLWLLSPLLLPLRTSATLRGCLVGSYCKTIISALALLTEPIISPVWVVFFWFSMLCLSNLPFPFRLLHWLLVLTLCVRILLLFITM